MCVLCVSFFPRGVVGLTRVVLCTFPECRCGPLLFLLCGIPERGHSTVNTGLVPVLSNYERHLYGRLCTRGLSQGKASEWTPTLPRPPPVKATVQDGLEGCRDMGTSKESRSLSADKWTRQNHRLHFI